jgi:hypothetical protein
MCDSYGHIHTDCPYAPNPHVNMWKEFDPTLMGFVNE